MPSRYRPNLGSTFRSTGPGFDVSGRGMASLAGLTLLGLYMWFVGFGFLGTAVSTSIAVVRSVVAVGQVPAPATFVVAGLQGMAVGLIVVLFRRLVVLVRNRSDYGHRLRPQILPALLAGLVAGLALRLVGFSVLTDLFGSTAPDVPGPVHDLLTDVGLLLPPGGGGPPPDPAALDPRGGLLAILLLLLVLGAATGWTAGLGMGVIGLGAVGGATKGATLGYFHGTSYDLPRRAGAGASARSGAVSGAASGALLAVLTFVSLDRLPGGADLRSGPVVGFYVQVALVLLLLWALLRRGSGGDGGIVENGKEAAKAVLPILYLAFCLAVLGGVMWLVSRLF